MIQQSLFEQINAFSKIFMSNKNIILVSIIAFITLIILEIVSYLKNKKITKIILISIYAVVFGTLLIFYNQEMIAFIDYLINNIFIFFFFPNLAVYTLVIIISNIFVIKSLLGRSNKILKNISIIFFILFNIIFYLIIDNCLRNNILVYETLSIYTNSELLTLIEISMYLFILYLVILLISKISKNIIISIKVKDKVPSRKLNNNLVINKEVKDFNISNIPEITKDTLVVNNDTQSIKHHDKSISETLVLNKEIKEVSNTLSLKNHEVNNLKTVNVYNEYMDIEPVKKKNIKLSNMEDMFPSSNMERDMKVLFGDSYVDNIMNDILKLKGNINNQNQIKRIYKQITVNSNNLSLQDYNYLISTLKYIKNKN